MTQGFWKACVIASAVWIFMPAAPALDLQLSAKTEPTPVPNVFCIRLSAVNLSSNQSVKVAADQAVIQDGSAELKPISAREIYTLLSQKQRQKKKRDQITATVISGGLATLTVGDIVDKKESNTAWLGKMSKRRNTKDTLFADRVLLPLDHSDGLIYFAGTVTTSAKLRIPSGTWPTDPAVPMTSQTIDVAVSP
jgi:hypothetical protein